MRHLSIIYCTHNQVLLCGVFAYDWHFDVAMHITSILYMLLLFPGTPEIGGLTTIQALEIIRGCRGMNIVGGDLVEVTKY